MANRFDRIESMMRVAKDTKKEFTYSKDRGKWSWHEDEEFDTFLECLEDAVSPYFSYSITQKQVVCNEKHLVDSDDNGNERYAEKGMLGRAEKGSLDDHWSVTWANGAWGFYEEHDLALFSFAE